MREELIALPVEALCPGKFQPRRDFNHSALQELAASIREQGIIEPIIVRSISHQCYEIIAGERRWRAAQLANLHHVPCIVRAYSDLQAAEVALIENIQRENLNAIEEAKALARLLKEFSYTHEQAAQAVGKSRARVTNCLRLLNLDTRVQQLLVDNKLSEGHGKAIAVLPFAAQYRFALDCIKNAWSVRYVERQVQQRKTQSCQHNVCDPDTIRLERIAGEHFNSEVKFERNTSQKGGWVKIKYHDHETLAGILEKMAIKLE